MYYFTSALKKYATFKGRASRKEFWMYILFICIFSICNAMIGFLVGANEAQIITMFIIITFVPTFAISIRRLHDINRSGIWMILNFIPFAGLYMLCLFAQKGTDGDNRYGPSFDYEQ